MKKHLATRGPEARGFVLPTLITLSLVLLLLAGAILTLGTSSLRVSTHDQQSEVAQYMAESGLARAVEEFSESGSLSSPYTDIDPETKSSFVVQVFENTSPGTSIVADGIAIPANSVYFRATGTSSNGISRTAGAVFSRGAASFQVGALADLIWASSSVFDAYDSNREAPGYSGSGVDPASLELNRAIMASNRSSGTVFDLTDAQVNGNLYVGPGADPTTTVSQAGTTTLGGLSALANPIGIDEIVVPILPDGESATTGSDPVDLSSASSTTIGGMRVFPNPFAVNFVSGCFNMRVYPNGDFTATENPATPFAGSELFISGNIHDIRAGGTPVTNTGGNRNGSEGFFLQVDDNSFSIAGSWHHFKIAATGEASGDLGPANRTGDYTTGHLGAGEAIAPSWLTELMVGSGVGGSVDNPLELEPGAYDTVNIDAVNTELVDEGTYVIKNLNITDSGHLNLAAEKGNVTIYVTESLTAEGQDAIINLSRKAPNLKIFYTGANPVNLAGGAQAFFTLTAPEANVNLNGAAGSPTDFFGALVGKTVSINNANFHYDVATSGIGMGSDSTTLHLLSRHR